MKPLPQNPMERHGRMIDALCRDLAEGHFTLRGPNVSAVLAVDKVDPVRPKKGPR